MSKTKLAIASDHAGILLKAYLKEQLPEIEWKDFGPQSLDSVDFPDYAEKACGAITRGECEAGVLVCGTGLGMSIAANKLDGIRAAHVESIFTARMAKEHNNANILCIGERVTGTSNALEMVKAWHNSKFETRHQKRIDKIHNLEKHK